ncbi:DEAD/DEAH box helicase [Candidatus Pacearchaeota archaeon]|nr:DEAD/DEAH box helicase [Candidatus Pacearchaeota archaeon]
MEFKSLKIIEPILRALKDKGYSEATPIQDKTIPLLLDGKDVVGIAQTGTGKTAAFAIPILQKLSTEGQGPHALILAPTRELAAQIAEEFKAYGKYLNFNYLAVYGGVGIIPQIKTLSRGVDILIATPGRLIDLMDQGKVNLKKVEFLVLDEADRMLDMGFLRDVKKIVKTTPEKKQVLLFSATMSKEIGEISEEFLTNPSKIQITPESTPVNKIEQCVFFIDRKNKEELLLDLIKQQKMNKVLVFVSMKHKANKIAVILNKNKVNAAAIHGNKSQFQREKALREFKSGAVSVLVATDIAARGIDVSNISHVVNYDLPNEPENYVHRIGRTARAGTKGVAYSFCEAADRNYLNQIERVIKKKLEHAGHKWHSVNAKSAEAKPKPRGQGIGRGRGRDKRKTGGGKSKGAVKNKVRSRGRGAKFGRGKASGSRRVAMGRTRSRR